METSSSPNNNPYKDWKFWAIWIVMLALLTIGGVNRCQAKSIDVIDTIPASIENVKKIVEKPSKNSVRYYAVYVDKSNDIEEILPVSKSLKDYIDSCIEFGITPHIGIKTKNGEYYSLIKAKKNGKAKNKQARPNSNN